MSSRHLNVGKIRVMMTATMADRNQEEDEDAKIGTRMTVNAIEERMILQSVLPSISRYGRRY